MKDARSRFVGGSRLDKKAPERDYVHNKRSMRKQGSIDVNRAATEMTAVR